MTGGWKPHYPQADGQGRWLVMTSWWVTVPDGRGCIDWDTESEPVDDTRYPDQDAAQAVADRLNDEWTMAEAEKRARQSGAPLP